jgi:hypothetical protein
MGRLVDAGRARLLGLRGAEADSGECRGGEGDCGGGSCARDESVGERNAGGMK